MNKNLSTHQLHKQPWQLGRIRHKLLLAFISINLVLVISMGSLSYFNARNALRNEAFAGIEALRETRSEQILLWFRDWQRDIQLLSANPTLVTSAASIINSLDDSTNAARTRNQRLQDIVKLYGHQPDLKHAGDNSVYSAIHNRVHPFFREILAVQGYTDILIISPSGDIAYTANKLDDFGTNVLDGPYPQLVGVFQRIAEADDRDFTTFTDITFYEPANQAVIFFGSPIFSGDEFVGALVLELPISNLNEILKMRQGLGKTGETYIVGGDMLFRSDSRFLDRLNVETTILNQNIQVDTEAGRSTFQGHTDTRIITSYLGNAVVSTWKPLALQPPTAQNPAGMVWALIVEKDTAEVDEPANELLVSIVLLTIAASLITFGGAYVISSQISDPIQRLTEAAKRIIDGQLDQQVEITTQDEVGTLAHSFNIMTTQLSALIDNLEEQVAIRTQHLEEARQEAEKANQAKSAFLANMSHELRTPLNAILGYAQILQRRPLPPDIIDNLRTVQRSGEHLLTLINDILDITKIEAGRMELYPVEIHFPTFMEHIAGIVRSRAEAKGLTFSFEELSALPAGVQADETRLRQVLLNLLANAVKFTEAGQVTLRVGSREAKHGVRGKGEGQPVDPLLPASRPYALLRFEVEDTGIGIPPDQLERIFQPFEQVGDLAHRTKGTGLGLAVSRQLVQLMGGELQMESEPGQGSTFWFEVMLPVTEVAVKAAPPSDQVITGYKGPRRVVLVTDDVPSNRAVLVDLLEPLGFDVVEAADGQQAIHLARELRPDLILMDRWMPVLDGFEATQQMRQNPELQEMVIIAISASVSAEDQARSREAGINAFLPKPVNWPKLAGLLEEHLGLAWEYETKDEGRRLKRSPPFILQNWCRRRRRRWRFCTIWR